MPKHHEFAREETFPSWFANRIQEMIDAEPIRLYRAASGTSVVADASADRQRGLTVQGRWRYITSPVTRAVGGAAGDYVIFATAKENSIVAVPEQFTDQTDYTFGLAVVAAGSTPSGVDLYERIGRLTWSGSAITALVQELGQLPATALPDEVFPSRGAGAAVEALRSLGKSAGQALPGDDPSVTNARTPTSHTHVISETTGLQSALDGKAAVDDPRFTAVPSAGSSKTAASYVLTAADAGKVVEMEAATGATNQAIIPSDANVNFPIGTVIEVSRVGDGDSGVGVQTGVTLRVPGKADGTASALVSDRWASVVVRKRAAGEWVVAGAIR